MNERIRYVFKNTHRKDTRVVVHKLKQLLQRKIKILSTIQGPHQRKYQFLLIKTVHEYNTDQWTDF